MAPRPEERLRRLFDDGHNEGATPEERAKQAALLLAIPPAVREQQAKLLISAFRRATRDRGMPFDVDSQVLNRFRSSFFGGGEFRTHHRVALSEVTADAQKIAFGGPTDRFREENAAFCHLMYQGLQKRFLDRYQGERPEDFLDRPRKASRNLTAMVIDILSKLYHAPPRREFVPNTETSIEAALRKIWGKHFNLSMLEIDRYTRLQGTTSVRPFFDPVMPGNIRLWRFRSDQLRVILDPRRPWEPSAVIERDQPFDNRAPIRIWTRFAMVEMIGRKVTAELHGMGRVPHTFFRDRLGWASFFVEGRGRSLCDGNATVNQKLTDLNEVFQMQGFGVPWIRGETEEDEPSISPRTPIWFKDAEPHHGLFFAQPSGAIQTIRQEIRDDVASILSEQRVPEAALGITIGRTPPSGAALREALRPLLDDLEERAMLFEPQEVDLADSCLRVLRENEPEGFDYDPKVDRPAFAVHYGQPEFSVGLRDQTMRDEFEIAHSIITAAQILRRQKPEEFKTDEQAIQQIIKNQQEAARIGAGQTTFDEDDLDAAFSEAFPLVPGEEDNRTTSQVVADMMLADSLQTAAVDTKKPRRIQQGECGPTNGQ